jgi:iron-sulfur cluster repair protein YtfE (RIC family)
MGTAATKPGPLQELSHDHRHLSELVLEVRSLLGDGPLGEAERAELADAVARLHDELLVHFAREEEGLFPFVLERLSDLAARVEALRAGHDSVCGAVSRLHYAIGHGTASGAEASWRETFSRFEALYGTHAREEISVLRDVSARLDAVARAELDAILEGL